MTPQLELELVAGHAEGWRVWRAIDHGGALMLRSVVVPWLWLVDAPTRAYCGRGHRAPARAHLCGLHAFAELADAELYLAKCAAADPRGLYVLGRVAGAGLVVEHEDGWRAERAAVLELAAGINPLAFDHGGREAVDEIVARLAVRYGVDRLVTNA